MKLVGVRELRLLFAAAIGLAGCRDDGSGSPTADGTSDDGGDDSGAESGSDDGSGTAPPTDVEGVGISGARRLTVHEYDNTVRDLLGDTSRPAASFLPEDRRTPFDNELSTQVASRVLVEGAETLARIVAASAVADADRRAIIVGCEPSGAGDETCMRTFVESHGRRMLRRPLTSEEVEAFVELGLSFADEGDDFGEGVEVVLRAFLQDPEFLYRIETGIPVEGRPELFRLDDYQVATRMAYLIWGSAPDDGLLDWAELGLLEDSAGRSEAATMMLADGRASEQIDRFHALWLGYDQLPHPPELTNAMRQEAARLVERVIFEDRDDWVRLMTSTETYLTPFLAEHYGLEGDGWTDVSAYGRMGLLSQGAFLSVGSNVDDTSPTKRGKLVRERLMCEPIPPPPPDVMADTPPTAEGGECRIDQYKAHREQAACAACHELMDEIGFGLERYDQLGRYRDFEYFTEGLAENENCPLDGQGSIAGVGSFTDPAGLAQSLVDDDIVQACVVQQLYGYAMGRAPGVDDRRFVEDLTRSFTDSGRRFDSLVLALVSDEAFAYRKEGE